MIRTGTLQFHDDISVTFLTKYKLFTRSTRLLDSVDNSQDRSSAVGVISTQTRNRRIVAIVLTIITILLFPSNPSTLELCPSQLVLALEAGLFLPTSHAALLNTPSSAPPHNQEYWEG